MHRQTCRRIGIRCKADDELVDQLAVDDLLDLDSETNRPCLKRASLSTRRENAVTLMKQPCGVAQEGEMMKLKRRRDTV